MLGLDFETNCGRSEVILLENESNMNSNVGPNAERLKSAEVTFGGKHDWLDPWADKKKVQ